MKPEDNIFDNIEDYLNHKLSPAEQQAFEETLQANPDLSQKVKAHELANDMILENRLLAVNKTLVDYHKSKGGWSTPSKIGLAVGLLAIGTGTFLYFSNTQAPQPPVVLKQETPITTQKAEPQRSPEGITKSETSKQILVQKESNAHQDAMPQKNSQGPTQSVVAPPNVISPHEVITPKEEPKPTPAPQLVEPTVSETPADPCSKIRIIATVSPKAACKDENDGSIWLSESKGGTAPYKMKVMDQHKQIVNAQQLTAGSYEILVKDAQGCTSIQKVVVPQRICDKDYLFNAFAGEQLEIPAHNAGGILKVFDKQGNIYATITVEPHAKAVWDGHSKNGELNEGFFNFVLEYNDHITARGTITIVR